MRARSLSSYALNAMSWRCTRITSRVAGSAIHRITASSLSIGEPAPFTNRSSGSIQYRLA